MFSASWTLDLRNIVLATLLTNVLILVDGLIIMAF